VPEVSEFSVLKALRTLGARWPDRMVMLRRNEIAPFM
jgi:hypothetical protein